MAKDRFALPAAVFLVLVKDGRVLLMRRANTGWHDGDFDLVAGHLDGGEALRTALVREAKEETEIDIAPDAAQFVHLIHGLFEDGKEYFNAFFRVEDWSGEPRIMEPQKCDALQWFDLDALPTNLTRSTRYGLEAIRAKQSYQDFGF